MLRCWRLVFLAAVVVALTACTSQGAESESSERSTTMVPSTLAGRPVAPESSAGGTGSDSSWMSTGADDELVAFVGIDGRTVVVGSADGRIVGLVPFDVPVEVEASADVDRIAVRDAGGTRFWIVDTSTGRVVDEFDGVRDPGVIFSGDGLFRAEVVDGDVDGKGSITLRASPTGAQTGYSSTEPGWVLAESGVAFARSSDLAALPTSSTSSDSQALMVASAESGDLVAFSGPEPHRFLGWVGSSCWLSATVEVLLTHCVDGGSISSIMEIDPALFGGDLDSVDPDHASFQRPSPLALSLPSQSDDDRRLVLVSAAAGSIEIGSGSFPRWSPGGRFLAVTTAAGLLVLDADGALVATYEGAGGSPAWTTSASS